MVDVEERATADEAPAGYRMTELGVLPEDWRVLPVSRAGRVITGTTPSTKVASYYGGTVPFITPAELNAGFHITATAKTLTDEGLLRARPLPPQTVLVSCIGYIGKTAITTFLRSASNQQINAVIPNDDVDPLFLYFALSHSRPLLIDRAAITTVPILNKSNFEQVPIPLPPLPEQRAIAHVLSTVQRAMEATEAVIAATRELKRSLMRHLFTYGPVPVDQVDGVRLKETEIGLVPEGWKSVTLGDLMANGNGEIQTGPFGSQLHSSDYKPVGIPVVNPTHLGVNSIRPNDIPRISREDADRLARHYLAEGDVLLPRRGDFSRYAYVGEAYVGWMCGTGCLRLRLRNPLLDNAYLALWLGTEKARGYLNDSAVGTIMPNLNQKILNALPVALPPIAQQHVMVNTLAAVDKKLIVERNRNRVVDATLTELLRGLMTGTKRVSLGASQ